MPMRAAVIAVALIAAPAIAQPVNGLPAPDFTATDANGKRVSLSDFRGKTVVQEWTNSGCPFVRAHYDSGTMQARQREARGLGVVWLSINSGAPGKQGHVDGPGARAEIAANQAAPTHYLLDGDGRIGRLYAAKTTPHMFVIRSDGTLAYQGGIDDKPTAIEADARTATPWALNAVKAVLAGKPPTPAVTRPYGCSIKYAG
ncbi:thioredoxin family protein [Sandarakinorhabdus cyanobacteriorum]|uniref:Thioredoxin family protein n=1 Tax=Sandarakinorhabdus cyanobacteriorum TaxID=1981098 RepID=A0A255Y694_9SPHN|nr:thioredoxin family protein [Sandarakinorhabdus cyanobacteriorum]OYQ24772.1 thioredoxin family protein [Sandarakinorhabdus cyanobacteriorum]